MLISKRLNGFLGELTVYLIWFINRLYFVYKLLTLVDNLLIKWIDKQFIKNLSTPY